jgi:Domain of unknown function (DUF4190)
MAKHQDDVLDTAATVDQTEVHSVAAPADSAKFDYTKLNTLAVVSIASAISWVGAVAGVVTGHVALAQIKRSGEKGRGLAITALVLGYLYIAGSILFGLLMLLFRLRGWIGESYGSYGDRYNMGPGSMGDWQNR